MTMAVNMRESSLQKILNWVSHVEISKSASVILTAAVALSCCATYVALTLSSTNLNTVYLLLNLDLVLLLLLGAVIARQVVKVWMERKRGMAGSRLHVRLVFVFSILAATPAILMAIFSSFFFYYGIQSWLNDRVSTAVNESLEVAQAYLKEHHQVMRADVLAMANDLNRSASALVQDQDDFNQFIDTQSQLRNLPEAVVVTSSGKVIAHSRFALSLGLDNLPKEQMQRADGGEVVLLTDANTHDRIRALVKLDNFLDSYLYVGRFVDAAVLEHMHTTEQAVKEYDTIQGRRSQLQISITLMFMVVALLLLMAAVWFGLSFSGELIAPISALITAAERVRRGDLSARVSEAAQEDELAVLGKAFNRMTSQIEAQQDALLRANRMLDDRRRFTEAVLAGASSGVIGLDRQGKITLANAKAGELLSGDVSASLTGKHLAELIPQAEALLKSSADTPSSAPLQLEYAIGDGPLKTLFIRMTHEQGGDGVIVTIDDISTLVSAQRKAAWADVARRIAHEIKNPLTPIQLSAERLKRKYLPQIQDDPETFEKCTETIVRQVTEIGHMVNEFSAYARMPVPVKKTENLVDVCQDALVLQRQSVTDVGFSFVASDKEILAHIDRAQLTQVITNLLQNGIDSIHDRQQMTPGQGHIKLVVEQKGANAVISLEDNGTGVSDKIKQSVFEPYVTTKKKGSGLGLAIVKKIMEDHGGSITIENISLEADPEVKTGAKAVIVFPKGVKG